MDARPPIRLNPLILLAIALAACNGGQANVHQQATGLAPGQHPLGYLYQPSDHHGFNKVTQAFGTPPASADISQFNPPVGDQGQIGDCTSWGAGYAMSGYLSRQNGGSFLYAPMNVFMQAAPLGSTDFGMGIQQVFSLMQNGGIDLASDYDLQMTNTFTNYTASVPGLGNDAAANDNAAVPSAQVMLNAAANKLSSYQLVFDSAPAGTGVCPGYPGAGAAIQNAIASGTPVSIAIPVPPEFDNYNGVTPVAPPTPTEVSRGGHTIFCAKYDPQGLWCQNSWGLNWGKAGWVQLSWAFVESCVYEADTASGSFGGNPAPPVLLPYAAVVAPSSGSVVSGALIVQVQVSAGTHPVSSVTVQVGNASGAAGSVGGYWESSVDTTQLSNGLTALEVRVLDSQGNQVTTAPVSIDIENGSPQPPPGNFQVAFQAPTNGQLLRGTQNISLAASGAAAGASVTGISIGIDGAAPAATAPGATVQFTFTTTAVGDGTHTLTAVATASDNESANATVSVTVDNTPPAVSLSSPTDGSTVSGLVTVSASASDGLSGVTGVTFFAGSTALGTVTSPPYQLTWDTTQSANGAYAVTATASDAAGNTATTAVANVTVQN